MTSGNSAGVWIGIAAFAAAKGGDEEDAYAMQRWLFTAGTELPADARSAFMQLAVAWNATRDGRL